MSKVKFFVGLILLSGFLLEVTGQDPKEYHQSQQGLLGRVRSMTEKRFTASESNGEIVKGSLRGLDTFSYNESGFLLECTNSNADGLIRMDVNHYDERGNRIEESRFDSDGEPVYKITYQYDLRGNQIEKVVHDYRGKPEFRINTTYNEHGGVLKIKKTYISLPATDKTIVENTYDAQGRLLEERMNDLRGPVKILYAYDHAGNKSEMGLYKSKKRLLERETFAYDANGRLIENLIYEGEDLLTGKITLAYDEKGNLTMKSRYSSDGQLLERETHEFKYDTSDNLVMEKHQKVYRGTDESSEMSVYSNIEGKGNWLKKLYYRDGSIQFVVEREIKYYEEGS
ncbi:MAG: RHS repeat domain-containing protein [Robiginitalea sp.]